MSDRVVWKDCKERRFWNHWQDSLFHQSALWGEIQSSSKEIICGYRWNSMGPQFLHYILFLLPEAYWGINICHNTIIIITYYYKSVFSKLINRIPEFSQKNYALASKICAGLLVAVGIFFIYEMFTVGDFGIAVNWNFFTSAWFWPLFVIGLVLAIVFCGKFALGSYDWENSSQARWAIQRQDGTHWCLGYLVQPLPSGSFTQQRALQ